MLFTLGSYKRKTMKTIIETQNKYNGRMVAGAIIVIFGTL